MGSSTSGKGQPASVNEDLKVFDEYRISTMGDGTTTQSVFQIRTGVEPYKHWETFAVGVAKRRKGERRDRAIGELVSMRRMMASAVWQLDAILKAEGIELAD